LVDGLYLFCTSVGDSYEFPVVHHRKTLSDSIQ
jgi:hypothetical protein